MSNSIDQERALYEKFFPIPDGAHWNQERLLYTDSAGIELDSAYAYQWGAWFTRWFISVTNKDLVPFDVSGSLEGAKPHQITAALANITDMVKK